MSLTARVGAVRLLPRWLAEVDIVLLGQRTHGSPRGTAQEGASHDAAASDRSPRRASPGAYTSATNGALLFRGAASHQG